MSDGNESFSSFRGGLKTEIFHFGGVTRGLDCSVLCDGCACEEIEQSINETCMHKSKYYVYKCLSYMD